LNIDGFGALLEAWRPSRRDITEVHLRQTRLPGGERFDGRTTIEAAWCADMAEFSLSDAAQHATVAPDGSLWTGRHWDVPVPPRSRGGQAFALSILGDFDGRDRLEGAQREAALAVCGKTGKFELLPFRMELCAGGSVVWLGI
jgi:hypothetical protein